MMGMDRLTKSQMCTYILTSGEDFICLIGISGVILYIMDDRDFASFIYFELYHDFENYQLYQNEIVQQILEKLIPNLHNMGKLSKLMSH